MFPDTTVLDFPDVDGQPYDVLAGVSSRTRLSTVRLENLKPMLVAAFKEDICRSPT